MLLIPNPKPNSLELEILIGKEICLNSKYMEQVIKKFNSTFSTNKVTKLLIKKLKNMYGLIGKKPQYFQMKSEKLLELVLMLVFLKP